MFPLSPGRWPSWRLPTLGGKQLWTDLLVFAGHRIQQNALTGHCRLLDPRDHRLAAGSFGHCEERLQRRRESHGLDWESRHLVLLLHGIFRSKDSLSPMARYLGAHGLAAEPINYASTQKGIDHHAANVEHLLDRLEGIDTISVVCHSMGGLLARLVLARGGAWRERIRVNRLVLIATPNQGASFARILSDYALFRALAGPAAFELAEAREHIPRPSVPFGLVVGVRGSSRGFNPLLSGDDDFTVTAQEAWLDGAEDVLYVPSIHTVVMARPEVIRGTERYLRTGRFTPVSASPPRR